MCFSAQASFIAGSGLVLLGLITLKNTQKKEQLYFKIIPLLFGIQQLFEGIVWITQDGKNPLLNDIGRYGFLSFAFVIWPILVPWAVMRLEQNERRKRLLSVLAGAGTVVGTMLAWAMIQQGVTAEISCHHIRYITDLPDVFALPGVMWYCIATILPLFVSSNKSLHHFGLLIAGSVAVTSVFYYKFFTSVWCFFSAIISFFIYKVK